MTALCTCGKPCPEASFVCGSCSDAYAAALGDVPGIAHELIITLSKQQRFVETASIAHRSNGFPYDIAASDALHALRSELVGLVRLCDEEKVRSSKRDEYPADSIGSMCVWLLHRVDGVCSKQWAPDALGLVKIVEHCTDVIDRPIERMYAGPCDECGHDLYVEPGLLTVVCDACSRGYDFKARRTWLLHVVDDRLATAPEVARALSGFDMPISAELIRQWRHRGRLSTRGRDRLGVPLYRIGDVIGLMHDRAARRAEQIEKQREKQGARRA
jgi:hypothetical protein